MVDRNALLRRGIVLEGVTVGYNTLEGLIAITAGLAAGSVALTGFGRAVFERVGPRAG